MSLSRLLCKICKELLTTLDRIFNTTGNRIVAVGLFNSFVQREDLSVQDYSIRIEQLFYRAYPGMNPDGSIFLMDRFVNGLISLEVKQRLRIPPQPSYFPRSCGTSHVPYGCHISQRSKF